VSLVQNFHAARMEAEKAFGNAGVYIEKLIESPHHIEFQIMADGHGETVHIGERDCSMQRRNQKIIEECPSPLAVMTDKLRQRMGAAAVKLAQEVKYIGAGTMEFLVDDKGNFYFMEMNTRIQVEHCITEEAYGIDLVKEQIKVAAGDSLSNFVRNAKLKYPRDRVPHQRGGSVQQFHPVTREDRPLLCSRRPRGADRFACVCRLRHPAALRFDDWQGDCHGTTRQNAIDRMRRALGEYIIRGPKTTIPLLDAIMRDPDFVRGKYDTSFVGKFLEGGVSRLRVK
jgi:acetyl-CoA carboxylase biotin carboxylase subunit